MMAQCCPYDLTTQQQYDSHNTPQSAAFMGVMLYKAVPVLLPQLLLPVTPVPQSDDPIG